MAKNKSSTPIFKRSEVAKILNVTTLTVANREDAGRYPAPKRDLNNYRIYTINDVLNLQLITYDHVDPKPIISVLYDNYFRMLRRFADELLLSSELLVLAA